MPKVARPAAGEVAKSTSNRVVIEFFHNGSKFSRTFSLEEHGKDFKKHADEFIETHNAKHPNHPERHAQVVQATTAPEEGAAQVVAHAKQKAKREKTGTADEL